MISVRGEERIGESSRALDDMLLNGHGLDTQCERTNWKLTRYSYDLKTESILDFASMSISRLVAAAVTRMACPYKCVR